MSIFYQPKASIECRRFEALTYEEHFHDHLELVYLQKGASLVRVDTEEYALQSGDVLLTFPNQLHAYQDKQPCAGVLCIFPRRPYEALAPLFDGWVPLCPVIASDRLPPQLPALMDALAAAALNAPPTQAPGDGPDLAGLCQETATRGYLGVLLGLLLPLLPLRRVGASNSNTVQCILRYCADNYQQDLSLESVAKELHISKYHISHLFSQKIHLSFSDFINTLRVQDACGRLKQGVGITQACMQAGFSSIRSFNRVFLRQTGMTPLKYQKKYREL